MRKWGLAILGLIVFTSACAGNNSDGTEFVSRSGSAVLAEGDAVSATAAGQSSSSSQVEGSNTTANSDNDEPSAPSSRNDPLAAGGLACVAESGSGGSTAFSDLTSESGIDQALLGMRGHAGAAGDVNGDGFVDLFVGGFADRSVETYQVRGASGPSPDRLLLGSSSGFVIDTSFPETFGRSSGAAFADLDSDGDLDLVIARNPREGERSGAPTEVLENDGGQFASVAVLDTSRGLRSIGVLDYDGDGILDLFLVEDRFSGADSVLLHNDGNFGFTDVTTSVGLPTGLSGLGVLAVDLDNSGTPDLFVAGDNRMFMNSGGRFEEVDGPFDWTFLGDEDDVAGVAAGDVNADGWLDLVVGQHFNSTLDDGQSVSVRLYLNRGLDESGLPIFEDVTEAAGLAPIPTKAPHVEVIDLNGDGLVDILTSASAGDGSIPAVLFNEGGSTPTFSTPSGLGSSQYWVAGATINLDGDAAPEIFMVEWEPAVGSRIFDNASVEGSFISVQVGASGSGGVGAIVDVFEAGTDLRIATVPIVASTGYGSGAEPVARAGIGSATAVDLVVRLPWSGGELAVSGVSAGSRIVVDLDGTVRCATRIAN